MVHNSDDLGFYMNSLKTYQQPYINFTNRYLVSATLSSGKVVTMTNLLVTNQESDLLLSGMHVGQVDYDGDGKTDMLDMRMEILKSVGALQVTSLNVLIGVLMNTTVLAFPSTIQVVFEGRNIAMATGVGSLRLHQNVIANLSRNDYGSISPLELVNYNVSAAFQSHYQQPAFLIPEVSKQVINYDAESIQIRLQLNLQTFQRVDVFPSPMQQLIWSWCQFLPVALAIFLAGYYTLVCCFEYEILESRPRYHV